jgi:putative lipoprotein
MMSRIVKAAAAGALLLLLVSNVSPAQSGPAVPADSLLTAGIKYHPDGVRPPVGDTFFGFDKVKHFMMSGFIEAVGFNSLQAVNVDRSASLAASTAVTLGIGVARELHDRRTTGLFSLGDLTWDTLGTAAALLIFSHSQR